ncbi:MAG TPA: YdeI/OmpD-associated family protein [Edaphobacter sp.]
MAGSTAKRFRAVLEPLEGGLGWVIARLPFDVQTTWKNMVRLRVKVKVGEEIFRTSLFTDAHRGGHFLLVNKKMQRAASARVGAMVNFTIVPDLEERSPAVPPELAKLLKTEKALAKWFTGLSESTRWEIAKWVEGVKSAEARQRRAEQMAERLMLTMESEKALPPILEVAFHKAPAARKGWEAMTLTQRRSHLLGVFYYQSPEARDKRVAKLVEDALRMAQPSPR